MRGDDNHLLHRLIRETIRSEALALEYPAREARRIGPMPPIEALQAVADHAMLMQGRFTMVIEGHEVDRQLSPGRISATLGSLRHLIVDRTVDPESAYRAALLDLRHGMEVVKLLRELARREMVFGLIRWSDDWLGARRTLLARAEAQIGWFAELEAVQEELATVEALEDEFEPTPVSTETDLR